MMLFIGDGPQIRRVVRNALERVRDVQGEVVNEACSQPGGREGTRTEAAFAANRRYQRGCHRSIAAKDRPGLHLCGLFSGAGRNRTLRSTPAVTVAAHFALLQSRTAPARY